MSGEASVIEESRRQLLAEEDDFGFDETVAVGINTVGHCLGFYRLLHALLGVRLFAVDAALSDICQQVSNTMPLHTTHVAKLP